MKKILLIHTGGTIAMSESEHREGIRLSDEHPLHSLQSELDSLASITTEQFSNLPSPHISPDTVIELAQFIHKQLSVSHYDGVVVTHGTDTLEETAYLLQLLNPYKQPIVLTGAMKSSNEFGSDGPNNLISAVRVALCKEAVDKGVLVVMNDVIHTATFVTKMHTSSVDAFQSIGAGPIGMVSKEEVIFFYNMTFETTRPVKEINKNVVLLKSYAGMDETLFHAFTGSSIDGLVIEGFGQGNLPPKIVAPIRKLISKGIPVILVSRNVNGIVQSVYDYPGGGKELEKLGVIFAKGLTGQKARIKLLLLLHQTVELEKIKLAFSK